MAKKEIEFDNNRKYEWWIISQSYFQSALINARVLYKKLSEYGFDKNLEKIYGNYSQSCEYLFFPILFNFKHGIEIYLKSIIGISNSKFPKNHNLTDLLDKAEIKNEKIKCIIEKYAYSRLFLDNNKKCDTENQFERYPQGFLYDNVELFSVVNERKNIVDQEKVDELIKDIEFICKNLRKISIEQDRLIK